MYNFCHDVNHLSYLYSSRTIRLVVTKTVGGQLIRLSVTRMMMMDMGMYGTYGKPDSYPNYVFSGQGNHHHHHHHQPSSVGGHVSVPPSPEVAPTHYYPQTAVAPYSSSSSERFLNAGEIPSRLYTFLASVFSK